MLDGLFGKMSINFPRCPTCYFTSIGKDILIEPTINGKDFKYKENLKFWACNFGYN